MTVFESMVFVISSIHLRFQWRATYKCLKNILWSLTFFLDEQMENTLLEQPSQTSKVTWIHTVIISVGGMLAVVVIAHIVIFINNCVNGMRRATYWLFVFLKMSVLCLILVHLSTEVSLSWSVCASFLLCCYFLTQTMYAFTYEFMFFKSVLMAVGSWVVWVCGIVLQI